MEIFRLARRTFVQGAGGAFSGEGAYLAGSRWNSPRHRMAFAASSESLATLEYLVHATNETFFDDVVLVLARLEERYIETFDRAKLPKNWRSFPPGHQTQGIGDAWLASARSAALRVPSAIIPRETNLLINPLHRDFSKIKTLAIESWSFDGRFRRTR